MNSKLEATKKAFKAIFRIAITAAITIKNAAVWLNDLGFKAEKDIEDRKVRRGKELDKSPQYEFWHYTGKAYSVNSTRYQDEGIVYIMTKFSLDLGSAGSKNFELPRCNMSIGSGDNVVVIFAAPANRKGGGYCVRAVNLSNRSHYDLTINMEAVQKKARLDKDYGLLRLQRDLDKFSATI